MKNRKIFSIIFAFALIFTVSAEEIRIVSLSPALTEIVCHLGGEQALVGRTAACNYPVSIRKLPSVGRFGTPEVEKIIALRPTLVIGNDLMNFNVARKLRELNIEVVIRNINTLEDYCWYVEFLGKKLSHDDAAAKELQRMQQQLAALQAMPPLPGRVLWVINAKPLMVAGPDSLPDLVMKLMKVENAAAAAPAEYFKCSQEWLLRSNPDKIIWAVPGMPNRKRGVWKNIPAVRQNKIIRNITRDPVMRPGPRFLESVIKLKQQLERL